LYALVLAPAVWVLVAVGLTHDLTARGRDGFAVESLTGLLLLLLGGAAYGILVFAPISPLGPVVAGLVFLVAGVWAIESPSGYAGMWPSGVVKDGFDLSRPGYGLAALLSVPLILTVLSVRRWSGFQPVVLPIIGTVGGARVAGAPVAALPTAVLPVTRPGADRLNGADERTTLIRLLGADATPDVTTVLSRPQVVPDDGDETTVLRMPAADRADEPATEDVAAVTAEEPTDAVAAAEEPTDVIADEQPTGQVVEETPTPEVLEEAPTEAVPLGNDDPIEVVDDGEPTVAVVEEAATPDVPGAGDEVTAATAEEPATEVIDAADEKGAAVVPDEVSDEATAAVEVVEDDVPAEESIAAADEPAAAEAATDDRLHVDAVEDVDEDDVVVVEETTYLLVPADDDDDRTQAIRLAAELEADGGRTQVIRPVGYTPGQTTRDLGTPGDRTQVIRPARRVPGETTQVIGLPGERTRRIVRSGENVAGLDETQLIRLPDPAEDGARTQVIHSGEVTPPSEHLRPSVVTPPDFVDPDDQPAELTQLLDGRGTPTGPAEPDAPPSIARAERPNFAEDPTGRLVAPTLPSDEPTRTMTVMNIERPPDEVPEIPSQRKPPAED
jgi:hypothetical protein